MCLHGVLGDEEGGADVGVRRTARELAQHLALTRAERRWDEHPDRIPWLVPQGGRRLEEPDDVGLSLAGLSELVHPRGAALSREALQQGVHRRALPAPAQERSGIAAHLGQRGCLREEFLRLCRLPESVEELSLAGERERPGGRLRE